MTFDIGDYVKVKDQDIYGEVIKIDYDHDHVVIRDTDAETTDDLLEFDAVDLELFKNRIGG